MNLEPMPIYEYYCAACEGRFRHLAKRIDASPPPCPRCGTTTITRLISAANVIHNGEHHERQLRGAVAQVNGDDPCAVSHFLRESGRLEDAEGVYGSQSYRELLARRAEGATDADMTDLVDDLVTQMRGSDASQMAGAMVFSDRVENRMLAEGPPDHHDHDPAADYDAASPVRVRAVKDLGWG